MLLLLDEELVWALYAMMPAATSITKTTTIAMIRVLLPLDERDEVVVLNSSQRRRSLAADILKLLLDPIIARRQKGPAILDAMLLSR